MDYFSYSVPPNENFLDLRLFRFGWEQCAPTHSDTPPANNHFRFYYILSGRGSFGGGTPEHLEENLGFLIAPNQICSHCADELDPWSYVWLEFGGLRAESYLNAAGLNTAQLVYRPKTPQSAEPVREAIRCIIQNPKSSTLQLTGRLCLFLDALIQASANQRDVQGVPLPDFYIQQAVNYMERHYQRELTVEEIAEVCQLNRSYFSKLFRDKIGCPPQEFLIRLRLSKAAELMRSTEHSIGDISAACGYPNQLHFSRAFKQRYGLSPREWRQNNQSL